MAPRKTASTVKAPAKTKAPTKAPARPSRRAAVKPAAKPAARKRTATARPKPARKRAPAKPPKAADPAPPPPVDDEFAELSNVASVRRDLKELGPEVEHSGLAAAAITLARDLDNAKNSATSHAMCAKALLDVMNKIRELAPPKAANDGIDGILAKRERRRKRLHVV